jgi:hypothetical protein
MKVVCDMALIHQSSKTSSQHIQADDELTLLAFQP